jgi:hypothetical protein
VKEYEFASMMSEGYSNRFSKVFEAVCSAMNNKHCDMLNFIAVKSRVEEAMQALEVKIRFDALVVKAKGKLTCSNSSFELDSHKFETLDEVEKALDNKAFL